MNSQKRALISVSDKSGLIEFASQLVQLGFQLISTGGTATYLKDAGLAVTEISALTQMPEMMDGRVKTLHPAIHAGILSRRGVDEETLESFGFSSIDVVVVNLYPFAKTIAQPHEFSEAIEQIDIGGPTLLRAAAKNFSSVFSIISSEDYDLAIEQLTKPSFELSFSLYLAQKVFSHISTYDQLISEYLLSAIEKESKKAEDQVEDKSLVQISDSEKLLVLKSPTELRYGENNHQKANAYRINDEPSILTADNLQGKPLSYNNVVDADTAWRSVHFVANDLSVPFACTIIKHDTPCGIGTSEHNLLESYEKAYSVDSVSAFGGIIAFNTLVDEELVNAIFKNQFFEIIIALDFTQEALALLAGRRNVRVIQLGVPEYQQHYMLKSVLGGFLKQQLDNQLSNKQDWTVVNQVDADLDWATISLAWTSVRLIKSNGIVLANSNQVLGIGSGQMNRVKSVKIAIENAQEIGELAGSVLASDAFFPFRDSIDSVSSYGIKTIIQPGGSVRDAEVEAACREYGMNYILTHHRHFKH